MPTRALPLSLAPCTGCLTSMFIACPPSESQPIIGRKRILHQDFTTQCGGNSCRHGFIIIELPVRKIRGVEQYSIGAQMVDRPFHPIRVCGRVEWLDGEANVIAHDLRRRAVDPGHLTAHAAPEFREPHKNAGSHVTPDSSSTTLRPGYLANTPSQTRLASCD